MHDRNNGKRRDRLKSLLKTWQYALGSYSDDKTQPYDKQMLVIRSSWVILHIATCCMIIIGNGRLLEWW